MLNSKRKCQLLLNYRIGNGKKFGIRNHFEQFFKDLGFRVSTFMVNLNKEKILWDSLLQYSI